MCNCDPRCAFHWNTNRRPSIFVSDGAFTIGAASGKSMSHIQSATVQRITRETGNNPGTIRGAAFSDAAKRAMEERQYQRRSIRDRKSGKGAA